MKLLSFLALLLFFGEVVIATEAKTQEQIDALVRATYEAWNAPGIAVAVVKNDNIIYLKGHGRCKINAPETIDTKTLFSIASLTKAFTSASIALLASEKKLNWNDPVIQHLPSFYLFDPYITQKVTIRDLLSHRTGLEAHDGDLLWLHQPYNRKEILSRIRYLTPAYGFRTSYAYQNILYLVAGEIIEKASGLTWDEFIQKKIFIPLGMNHSFSVLKTQNEKGNIASPHSEVNHIVETIPWECVESIGPACSIVSNITDMAQWLRFHLKTAKGEKNSVIDSDLLSEAYEPHIHVPMCPLLEPIFPDANFIAYGMGWFLQDYHGRKVIQHDGTINGMSSFIIMVPDDDLGVIVLANLEETFLPYAISYKILDYCLGKSNHDWDKELKASGEKMQKADDDEEALVLKNRTLNTHPSHPLQVFTGTYHDPLYGFFTVWLDNNSLKAKMITIPGKLEHWHYDTFRFIPEDKLLSKPLITFTFNAFNAVESVKIPEILPKTTFKAQ